MVRLFQAGSDVAIADRSASSKSRQRSPGCSARGAVATAVQYGLPAIWLVWNNGEHLDQGPAP
jgi:hypothetical protein